MASIGIDVPRRRGFLKRAGVAMAALLAGSVAARPAFGSASATPSRSSGKKPAVWIVDFLTVSGRVIKPFAREEDAKEFVAKLIVREIEAGQVRQPATVLQRIAAHDLDGAIAAYRADQRIRFRGGEVAVLEEGVA